MAKKTYYKRSDGLYEAIRVINGKRKAFRGHTPREVEQKMIAYQGEVERGRLFRDVAEEWKFQHFPTLAPKTLSGYEPAYKRAMEEWGDIPITQITAPQIKSFLLLFSHSDPNGKPRSQKTINTQKLVINLILSYAVEKGDIEYNPCASIKPPRGEAKHRRDAATTEDEKKIKKSVDIWFFPYFLLYTGLRRGEALALKYGDIDLKARTITVKRATSYTKNKAEIKGTKTSAGERVVPILDPLLPKLPKNKGKSLYVFSADGGEHPLKQSEFQTLWANFVKETGITCTPHQLRHSYATMLFECGVDVKDAQDLLGHSTAAMTQDIYTHIRNARRKQTAQLINDKLGKIT